MLGLIQVNLIFKNSSVQLGFTFKGQKAAEDLLQKVQLGIGQNGVMKIEDDFACKAHVNLSDVSGVILNDMDREITRGTMLRVEQEKALGKAIEAECAKPENRILQPAGTPLVANA